MSQPYGGQQPQQPGGQHPGSGGFQQPGGQYPNSGGLPQAPTPPGGYNQMPQAPQEYSGGPIPRPGTVTGAAVLAYIQAGITTITTILVWLAVTDLDGGLLAYRVLIALAQTVGIALLIMGGVQIMGGKSRNLLVIGAGLEVALSLAWLIEFAVADAGGIDIVEDIKSVAIGAAIFFAIMPAISLFLALGQPATQFLQSRRR